MLNFQPDVLQTDAEDFAKLDVPDHIERWPVYREEKNTVSVTLFPAVNRVTDTVFVYEGARSGAGQTVDWDRGPASPRRET